MRRSAFRSDVRRGDASTAVLAAVAIIATGAVLAAARSAWSAREDASSSRTTLARLQAQTAELSRLRAASEATPVCAEAGLTTRAAASLAGAGLPTSSLTGLTPDADVPLPNPRGADGRPLLTRRAARLSLDRVTLPQLGRFLDTWRAANPSWAVTAIDICPVTNTGTESAAGGAGPRELPLRAVIAVESTCRIAEPAETGGTP